MLNYDFEELEDKKNATHHVFMQFSMMNKFSYSNNCTINFMCEHFDFLPLPTDVEK